ncbi:hypothetical protein QBC38DRAFT_488603 [Podospora fimiseda]|uniref:Uncharacterized protein n=1 Tax=Podospora fimiseda TaxID=252190 RepID=A0AAN6YPN9_9PEZI|nr:hypothetical protein QBC38DRAFT_488603 [Podospora fimiseda]
MIGSGRAAGVARCVFFLPTLVLLLLLLCVCRALTFGVAFGRRDVAGLEGRLWMGRVAKASLRGRLRMGRVVNAALEGRGDVGAW